MHPYKLSVNTVCASCNQADAGSAFWDRERRSRPWLQEPVTAAAAAKNSAFELECREKIMMTLHLLNGTVHVDPIEFHPIKSNNLICTLLEM